MLCRVEMPTNEQIFGRFYRYQMMRGKDSATRNNLILLAVVFVILCAFLWYASQNLLMVGALAALLAFYLIYTLYLRPNSLFRKKPGAALQTEVYIFTDTGYTRSVRSEEGGMPDNASGRFDGLVMAVETGKDFYLYTSPKQAYLVDKEYFTKGTPEELRETLQKALRDKFKGPKR